MIATYDEGNVSNNTLHSVYPLESNTEVSLYYLLGLLNSTLLNWYYKIVNYLEIGKPMAEVKGIYIKKLPIAIGMPEQVQNIEQLVQRLLDLYQKRYDSKYDFINYILKAYEPQKISEKVSDFEVLSFKEFLNELKKAKINLSATQQKDLLELFEKSLSDIADMDKSIKEIQKELDFIVFDIYKIPDTIIQKIIGQVL